MVGDILQPTHLLFILVVALLVLGPKRLPEVGRALGDGLRDFKSAINGESHHRPEEIAPEATYRAPVAADHEFAHAESETETDGHSFAHEEPAANGHESPGDAQPGAASPGARTDSADSNDSSTADKHEFAYESSDPAQSRDDPRS